MVVHSVIQELEDDEVDAVAGHVSGGHSGHAPVQPSGAVSFDDLLQALAGSAVVASSWCRAASTGRGKGDSCPHTVTPKKILLSWCHCFCFVLFCLASILEQPYPDLVSIPPGTKRKSLFAVTSPSIMNGPEPSTTLTNFVFLPNSVCLLLYVYSSPKV